MAFFRAGDAPPLGYLLHVPAIVHEPKVLVLVHGVSSTASTMARYFAPLADRAGVVLMAPDFSNDQFRGYQRLKGRDGSDEAAVALDQAAHDVAQRLGLEAGSFDLFGFSGGAQFAHRFAMTRPDRVRRLIVAAAGWYTECDLGLAFPQGVRRRADHATLRKFLALPISIVVGDHDVGHDDNLRKTDALDRRQGFNRLERANFWAGHLRAVAAAEYGADCDVTLTLLSQVGHSFRAAVKDGDLVDLVGAMIAAPAVSAPSEAGASMYSLAASSGAAVG